MINGLIIALCIIIAYIIGRLLCEFIMMKLDDKEYDKYELVYDTRLHTYVWSKNSGVEFS